MNIFTIGISEKIKGPVLRSDTALFTDSDPDLKQILKGCKMEESTLQRLVVFSNPFFFYPLRLNFLPRG